ncbi:cytochrome c [Phaeovibrio sulfidiphilus]|uniref:Cytochrome c n=1 Tax=Phaeovibrio sulfidiphilus TaxID=1220600 RepID=A0A8J7CNR8_9PROT|nr:cytochrome c [Phaeovibrio sulfidiphilus]MBE1236212.1 cytochrome c [Phaeovibrio sulfidiphilus]
MKRFLIAGATAAAVALGAFSPALAQQTAEDYQKMRSDAYKAAGGDMKALAAAMKSRKIDAKDFSARANSVADNLAKATSGYAPGMAAADTSAAMKTIWQEQEKFQGYATAAVNAAKALAAATTLPARGAALSALGDTCKACHDVYRSSK